MSQQTHDQFGGDAELLLGLFARPDEATGHNLEGDASAGVGLRVIEHFRVYKPLLAYLSEVRPREVKEVLFLDQHVCADVIVVQEILQVAEVRVLHCQFLDGLWELLWKFDTITLG